MRIRQNSSASFRLRSWPESDLLLVIQPTLQGVEAVGALLEAKPGDPTYMIGVQENKVTRVPLVEAVEMVCG